jgi:predicted patatin/cPLA2 family phospholipase
MTTMTGVEHRHQASGFSGNSRTALVIQGGGLRGAYPVGVLRVLHDYFGRNPFDTIISVSSSVFTASFFLADQVEDMEATWRDLVHGKRLINYSRIFRGKSILGLDYLIGLFRGPVRLDLERVLQSGTELYYVLTDYATGRPEYCDAKCPDIFDLMRASSALPHLYRIPVHVNGRPYYDGGCSDPIPVEHAIALGFKKILVVLTDALGALMSPPRKLMAYLLLHGSPGARKAYQEVHERHNRALDLIRNPPPGVEIQVIAPTGLEMSSLTRNRVSIIKAIEDGKQDAANYLARNQGFLPRRKGSDETSR